MRATGGDKAKLVEKNSMMNLPFVVDGETIVTQSNSVLLYLGKKLGIDKAELFFLNHQASTTALEPQPDHTDYSTGCCEPDSAADCDLACTAADAGVQRNRTEEGVSCEV